MLDSDRWERAREIFRLAAEREPEAWPALLDHHCGDDAELRGEVEGLLAAHHDAGGFLSRPVIEPAPEPEATGADDPYLDREIGPYRTIWRLGRGGMGAVYLALRTDREFQKRVALKVLRPGMDSEEVVRRFRTERQILASLEHPNIARLLDGGTTEEGLPYLVMEYVEGQPIDDYCDAHRLSVRERIELLLPVCEAVQYAHRNLVVHRDLKPSNLLVTGDGTPKLLDFGIAKLLNPELTSPRLAPTRAAVRLMTPDYASPEQLLGEPITTASDVYSLGILLYYLLSGHHPYRLRSHSPVEIAQVLREHRPERPSTAALKSVGEHRGTKPDRLRRRLRGDLDNIVLMAMRKEPHRRYASVEQLAEDLRRHLAGHPVLARKDTLLYRWSKFVRRHRVGVAAAGAFVAACLAFGVVMGVQRDQIARERDRAERIQRFLTDLLQGADPLRATGDGVTVVDLLDEGARRLETEMAELPEVRADLSETLGVTYKHLGHFDKAERAFERALDLRLEIFGPRHRKVAEGWNGLADLKMAQGDLAGAEELLRRALAVRRELHGEQHPEVAESLNDLGKVAQLRGDLEAAGGYYRRALELRRQLLGEEHVEVAETLNNLAGLLWAEGRYAEAEPLHRQALALREKLLGPDHVEVSESLNNLAALLRDMGKYPEAQAKYERALELRRKHLGEDHPRVATVLNNLAGVRQDRGDLEGAEPLYRQAATLYREKLGPEHPYVAIASRNLATLHQERGEWDEAEELYRRADAILRAALGDRHPLLGWNTALLATLHDARGDPAGCERLARQAVDVLAASQPEGHWQTATAEATLGSCLLAQGRWDEAEPLLLRSRDALGQTPSARASRTLSRVEELLLAVDREREATPRRSPGAGSPPRTSGASPAPPPGG